MESGAMLTEYVQARDGNFYIGTSRVSLESIVVNWRLGQTPELIHEAFPTVRLAAIYGAIAHYLDHQEEVDRYLQENEELRQVDRAALEAARPQFYATMRRRFAEAASRLGLPAPETARPDEFARTEEAAARSPVL